MKKVSYHFLYTRAYMGHLVVTPKGKKIPWYKLRDKKGFAIIQTEQQIGQNIKYTITPAPYQRP